MNSRSTDFARQCNLTNHWLSIEIQLIFPPSYHTTSYILDAFAKISEFQKISTFDIFQKDEWNHKERDWLYQRKYFGRRQVLIFFSFYVSSSNDQFNSIQLKWKKNSPPSNNKFPTSGSIGAFSSPPSSPLLLGSPWCLYKGERLSSSLKWQKGVKIFPSNGKRDQDLFNKWEKGIKIFSFKTNSSLIALSPSLTMIFPQSQTCFMRISHRSSLKNISGCLVAFSERMR